SAQAAHAHAALLDERGETRAAERGELRGEIAVQALAGSAAGNFETLDGRHGQAVTGPGRLGAGRAEKRGRNHSHRPSSISPTLTNCMIENAPPASGVRPGSPRKNSTVKRVRP